ncbi:MAG: 3,4-dihydroxy-2-butanone-4-phosphate synthase [Proteobacteria bacterium]|nr:3,4-dihydroxy-2-butanone-4-phosphate synthase [Pseudomonadota bacterium]
MNPVHRLFEHHSNACISRTEEIIADIKAGKMVILVDEEDRENEGDLVLAADFVTPEKINFMARFARGLICLTLTEDRCRQLELAPMAQDNRSSHGTAFTVSIEAATGVTTGISAHDRARTVQAAVARDAKPGDIVQPGHVFPIAAQPGGVMVRAGHTEAGCDLTELAGLTPAAVICEIMKDDGSMARLPDLIEFGQAHGLKIGTIADLIHFRSQTESLVERVAERDIATAHGAFRMLAYREKISGATHVALARGAIDPEVIVLLNCAETAEQLAGRVASTAKPWAAGRMELLTYGIGAQILRDLNVGKMRLMATPRKMPSMAGWDLEVAEYVQPHRDVKA